MEYGIGMKKSMVDSANNYFNKRVREDLRIAEETVSVIRLEVIELQKQNKETILLIEDLSFKVETTNPLLEENTCNNCKDNYNIKYELSYLALLKEHSVSSKVLNQENNKQLCEETSSC